MGIKRTLKIAAVAGFPPDPYGEAHYSGQAYSALARQRLDIEVLVCAHRRAKVPTTERPLPNLLIKRVTNPRNRFLATLSLVELFVTLVRFWPALVHFQGVHTPRYGGVFGEPVVLLIGALRLLGIKVVYSAHSIWLRAELEELWARHRLPAPLSKALSWLYGVHLRTVSRWSSAIHFVVAGPDSPLVDQYEREYFLPRKRLKREIHPCTGDPTPPEAHCLAKQALGLSGRTVIASVGFIRPDKAYHLLLDCAAEMREGWNRLAIVIAGMPDGEAGIAYARDLQARLRSLPDEPPVILRSEYLQDEELSTLMDASDIVVVPYIQASGPSGPIHHALGRGKAVIATHVGHNIGLSSVCKLIPPMDARALLLALRDMLSTPEALETYRTRSIHYASLNTWDKLAASYFQEYLCLLEKSHGSTNVFNDA